MTEDERSRLSKGIVWLGAFGIVFTVSGVAAKYGFDAAMIIFGLACFAAASALFKAWSE